MQIRTESIPASFRGRRRYCTFKIVEASIQPGKLDHAQILTPKQVAQRLQVGISFIYENTRRRAGIRNPDPLPSIRMGKYLRFYWPEVEKWLERRQGGQNA
jgi:predicted DNA-binding transcriptional regulator AlpA